MFSTRVLCRLPLSFLKNIDKKIYSRTWAVLSCRILINVLVCTEKNNKLLINFLRLILKFQKVAGKK